MHNQNLKRGRHRVGRRNIWRHNSQEFSKISDRHQTIDPRISEDTKKDKYKMKPNNIAPHTYTDCIKLLKTEIKIKFWRQPKKGGKKEHAKYIGTKIWVIADFFLETI